MLKSKVLKSLLAVFGTFLLSSKFTLALDLTLKNPIGETDPKKLIGKIIATLLGLVGTLALVMFIYGGFTWMLSGGSADKVKKGQDIFVWSTLGIVIIFMSYLIIRFIFDLLK